MSVIGRGVKSGLCYSSREDRSSEQSCQALIMYFFWFCVR